MNVIACWFAWASILTLALYARHLCKSWLAPAAFMPLFWCGVVALPLLCAPEFDVWPGSILIIGVLNAGFSFAALAGERRLGAPQTAVADAEGAGRRNRPVELPLLRRVLWLSVLAGLGSTFLVLQSMGRDLSYLTSLQNWVQLGSEISSARYEQGYVPPLLARLLSVGFYLGALVGGVVWAESRRWKDRWLSMAPILAALFYVMLVTTRATLLFSLELFFSSRMAMSIYRGQGSGGLLAPRRVIQWAVLGASVFIVFVAAQMVRGGVEDLAKLGQVTSHVSVWFLGHLAAFSHWVKANVWIDSGLRLGERTLGGVFELLGVSQRESGVFTEYVTLEGGRDTNIYTALRGLIEDFSLPGATLFIIALGYWAGAAYRHVARGNILYAPLLALSYAFILWSHVISIVAYNTIVLAYVAFFLIVARMRLVSRRSAKPWSSVPSSAS